MNSDSKIAIVGGGAAGLTVAWFLKKSGFKHVTVLEKSERIGGKCKSLTYKGRSFDLGANYITSSYTQVRKLAREFGMDMFVETKGHAFDQQKGELVSLLNATIQQYGLFKVGWQAFKFMWHRFCIRDKLAPNSPGFLAASDDQELCGPFTTWLENRGLYALEPMFNIPLTLMGYDKLQKIPAAYALTYMNSKTFFNLMMFAANPPFRGWPKRFDLGYERLLERLAAEVDVLRGAEISKIERGDKVVIHYDLVAAKLYETEMDHHVDEFDLLILACPLTLDVLKKFLNLSYDERELFAQVKLDPFVVATYPTSCKVDVSAVTFMLPRPAMGEPYVVTKQFDEVPLLSIYSRMSRDGSTTRDQVLENNRRLLRELGADDPEAELVTYDEWPYFPHVLVESMQQGFYKGLEGQQGANNTYYVGGLLGFELVETIAEYSRHLVKTHFGGKV
jgi:hypothetical protein